MAFPRALALAAAAAIQGCASSGVLECDSAPARAAPAGPGDSLSLVSWNVHALPFDGTRARRLDNIAGEIARRAPDLVLLQEVWLEGDAARLGCRLAARYERVRGPLRGGLLAFVQRSSAWQVHGEASFERYTAAAPWYRLEEFDGIAGKGFQGFTLSDGARQSV